MTDEEQKIVERIKKLAEASLKQRRHVVACEDPTCPCQNHPPMNEVSGPGIWPKYTTPNYPSYTPNHPSYPSYTRCVLNGPLMISIPPGGMHVHCPLHGSHFIQGSHIWM